MKEEVKTVEAVKVNEDAVDVKGDVTSENFELVDYEKEGELAADYIEEFLDIADVDGDLDIEIKNGRTYISLNAGEDSNLNNLVGNDGKTLVALQELTRLAVLQSLGVRSRFVLDIQGYRKRKFDHLQKLAENAIKEATESNEAVHMKPMGAYERKVVHDAVAEAGLYSESENFGLERHVVVSKVIGE